MISQTNPLLVSTALLIPSTLPSRRTSAPSATPLVFTRSLASLSTLRRPMVSSTAPVLTSLPTGSLATLLLVALVLALTAVRTTRFTRTVPVCLLSRSAANTTPTPRMALTASSSTALSLPARRRVSTPLLMFPSTLWVLARKPLAAPLATLTSFTRLPTASASLAATAVVPVARARTNFGSETRDSIIFSSLSLYSLPAA